MATAVRKKSRLFIAARDQDLDCGQLKAKHTYRNRLVTSGTEVRVSGVQVNSIVHNYAQ